MELRYGEIGENTRRRSVDLPIDRAAVRGGKGRSAVRTVSLHLAQPERLGRMAVLAAEGALCAEGVLPKTVSASILMPVGTQEMELRVLAEEICAACAELGLFVEDIRAEVTNAVTRPVVTASCAGDPVYDADLTDLCSHIDETDLGGRTDMTGDPDPDAACDSADMTDLRGEAAEYIVMTKWAALEGTWLLAEEKDELLGKRFPEWIMENARRTKTLLSVRRETEIAIRAAADTVRGSAGSEDASGALAKYPVGNGEAENGNTMVQLAEGGIFAALWRLSMRTGKGFRVELGRIPLLQETIEITNYLGINPYEMRSAGSMLIVTKDPAELTRALEDADIPAQVIGVLTRDRDKLILNRGEKRYLDRPREDALLQVFDRLKVQREN